MPQMLRDYMASRGYNPDTICVFAASDDGNTVLAPDMEPQKCAAPTGATKNKRRAMLTCMWHSCTGPDSHEVEDMTLEKA